MKELSTKMEENGISKQGAITIVSYLTEEKYCKIMIEYIHQWPTIITDHQIIQHAQKIIRNEVEPQMKWIYQNYQEKTKD